MGSEQLIKVNPYKYELKEPIGTEFENLISVEQQTDPLMD